MKIKSFLLLLIIIAIPILTFAQANYKKGLVVTTQNDTLRGFIDYKEWLKNPKSISFKTSLAQKEEQEFTPATGKYFAIENLESYLSYQGRISADQTALSKITSMIDTSKVFTRAFLKVLEQGNNVSLLMLTDDIKVRFFLKDNNENTIQELTYRRYYDLKTNNNIVNAKGFMGQFWVVATKYNKATPQLKKQLEVTEYVSTDLIKIAAALNNTKVEKIKTGQKASLRYFAGLGANYSITHTKGALRLSTPETVYTGSTLPKLVIGVDKFTNPNVRKLIFRAEASYTRTFQKITSTVYTTDYKEEFKQNIFSLSPQIIYNLYNRENVKFHLGAGISANIVHYPVTKNHNYDLENFYFSIPLRAGLTVHNIEISAIYFPPAPISKYQEIEFLIQSVHVQVNYLFNK